MVLYPNKLPESERVCFGICTMTFYMENEDLIRAKNIDSLKLKF